MFKQFFKRSSTAIFLLGLLLIPTLVSAQAADITDEEILSYIKQPELGIEIPGLEFSSIAGLNIIRSESTGEILINSPFLGEYIASVYSFGLVAITILAIIWFIIGGLTWAASGGNAGRIDRAKSFMTQAIAGVVIAASSYTILWTINPNLVAFRTLEVQFQEEQADIKFNEDVQPVNYTYAPGSYQTGTIQSATLNTAVAPTSIGFNNVPKYKQGAAPWGKLAYGDLPACDGADNSKPGSATCCTTMAYAGCGPTNVAMVLQYYGKQADPGQIAQLAVANEARACNSGSAYTWKFRKTIQDTYAVTFRTSRDIEEVLKLLAEKKPVIFQGEHQGYTPQGTEKYYKGHYVTYTGLGTEQVSGIRVPVVYTNDSAKADMKFVTQAFLKEKMAKGSPAHIIQPK
jgi:hypothetical protein